MTPQTSGVIPPAVIAAAIATRTRWDIPASICLAQWALESGWGRFMPNNSNNPFGIKAVGDEPFVIAMTREVLDGREVRLPQKFRRFADLTEAFAAHGRLLGTSPVYAAAQAVRHDPRAFARALQGRYATDPDYAKELIGLMDARDLYRFDAHGEAAGAYDLRWVQDALNRCGSRPVLVLDGMFGIKTREAIRIFQARHNLFQDGDLKADTLAALARAVMAGPSSSF